MNEIKIFENEEFGKVRIIMNKNGNPIFCAKDIANALGYSDTKDAVARHCKSGEKVFHPHANGMGGTNMIYISEKDVYRLIMRSNLPDAEKFQDWVYDEVLPSIRKYGAYMTAEVLEKSIASPDYAIGLLTELKKEQEKRLLAEKELNKKNAIIEEQAPLVKLGDAVMEYDDDITINELAKILCQNGMETGERRLRQQFKDEGFLNGNGLPSQKSIESGIMVVAKRIYEHPFNGPTTYTTPLITNKGKSYFINRYLK